MAIKVKKIDPEYNLEPVKSLDPVYTVSYYVKRDGSSGYGLFKITTVNGYIDCDEMLYGGDVLSITLSKMHAEIKKDLGL